ncbi:uncharacterized protein LOC105843845 isoform X1 [Hydra vulgaris]|uniref:uncharacterized protein LOC105843845 isoform X1 n=1 Tax=Hydra vulgaris TaxID=6087 RepID=UPI001F5FDB0D|nr:uncharacterized protein LOC105843845 [Hydra vulgaris]
MALTILILLFTIREVILQGTCYCNNNGFCNLNGSCNCSLGFYGVTCGLYDYSYKIQYVSTPNDVPRVLAELISQLSNYNIANAFRIDPGNIIQVVFYKIITDEDLLQIQKIAFNIGGPIQAINDYNECLERKQACYSGSVCVNTLGSFNCILNETKSSNFPIVYIWVGAVGAVLILMLLLIVCVRRKKKKKMKKREEQMRVQEQERKIRSNSAFASADLSVGANYIQNSRHSSVFGETSSRALVLNGVNADSVSAYSYNSRNFVGLDSDRYHQRLSVPMLDSSSYSNFGFARSSSVPHITAYDIASHQPSINGFKNSPSVELSTDQKK